jgi:two-component system, chemotaxis family, protein-glutamate methylesterase/glutaminase
MQEIKGRVLRVMVADDSAVMRGIMRTLFATHAEEIGGELPAMVICGEASDGVECLEIVKRTQPDVLLLDLEMPRMHGLGVLDRLRAESPELPVIMCSAYTELGARLTVDALARGASDYVMKPSVQSDFTRALRVLSEQLLPKIAALASGRRRRCDEGRAERQRLDGGRESRPSLLLPALTEVIVIGVSTGGPLALEMMLPMLPVDLPVPVLIVQHMPRLFTGALAERLNRRCALRVREAHEGAVPEPGTVWLAPGDLHMEVVRTGVEAVRLCLHQDQPVNYCRPSVDHLFNSAASVYGAGTLAAVMTGMGADGLAGARRVHEAGGTVLAQDQESSVVWGMPGRVTQAGIASATLPLMSLGEELTRRAWQGRRKREESNTRQRFADGGVMHGLEAVDGLF